MIFKQFINEASSTYTYIVAHSRGREAFIIDPVLEDTEKYLQFLGANNLRLIKAFDTHIHADHITGLGRLRDLTGCITIMGEKSNTLMVSQRVSDGDKIKIDELTFEVLYTPGHTDCSYSLYFDGMLFTGDALFIRGNGRTDFQNGNPKELYQSIKRLLSYPDTTTIYPGHDYKGESLSTVGREKKENPRFAGKSESEFVDIMNNLNLPNPKMMDVAVPANQKFGEAALKDVPLEANLNFELACTKLNQAYFIDLREPEEIKKTGIIPNAVNISYQDFIKKIENNDQTVLSLFNGNKEVVLYCAYGERSALAIKKLPTNLKAFHILKGIQGWIENQGLIEAVN